MATAHSARQYAFECKCIYTQPKARLQCIRSTPKLAKHHVTANLGTSRMYVCASQSSNGSTVAADISIATLVDIAQTAARQGAEVVHNALDKPKNISYKGVTDLVTDTDKASEAAVLTYLQKQFPDHGFLGEEGGVSGNSKSPYLWVVDPLDGTTNFSHAYPSFGVSVAVVVDGQPIAASVVEFSGGPGIWVTRTFKAGKGEGAFANDQPISVTENGSITRSLLVSGFGYERDDAWKENFSLFQHFTDKSQGVRRLGAAAIDLCHVALGITDGFWEYRLKPWDVSAGVLMVREAGGHVTDMEGKPFSVFSRSLVASNSYLHKELTDVLGASTANLQKRGVDLSPWFIPSGYSFKEE